MSSSEAEFEAMSDAVAWVIQNPEEAMALLPEEEQRAYREAQESVIEARRAGERIAREIFIG